jgi:hypothetical protein
MAEGTQLGCESLGIIDIPTSPGRQMFHVKLTRRETAG